MSDADRVGPVDLSGVEAKFSFRTLLVVGNEVEGHVIKAALDARFGRHFLFRTVPNGSISWRVEAAAETGLPVERAREYATGYLDGLRRPPKKQ